MIRYSLEYLLYGLNAARRQSVTDDTTQALQTRTKEGTVNSLEADREVPYRDANGDPQVELAAFCEVNDFIAKQDADQIFAILLARAQQLAVPTSPVSNRKSYIRFTTSDDETGSVTLRISRSPSWPDDPGTVIAIGG